MKREDFIKIIKLRSFWKIDHRKGDYQLPGGKRLSHYIDELVRGQMRLDSLGIQEDGNLCCCSALAWNDGTKEFADFTLTPLCQDNEICSYQTMEKRISRLVNEIVG